MDFGWALNVMRSSSGRYVARSGWNGRDMRAQIIPPRSPVTVSAFVLHTADGNTVPWVPSQTDLLARDWHEVEEQTIYVPRQVEMEGCAERAASSDRVMSATAAEDRNHNDKR